MNGPFRVAQADVAITPSGKPVRVVKVAKPFGEQSVVVPLSYDGSVKADLSAIAGEKITLVHIGEKLIILFDNKSTVTLEPFFDSTGKPLDALHIEVSPGRELTGAEFAQLFPVTEDSSILPAAGEGNAGGAQASGAYFTSVGIDPLSAPNPLALLGQEELPNFVINDILNPLQLDLLPLQTDIKLSGIVEEEQLGSFNEGNARALVQLIGTDGNDDPNDATAPKGDGTNADGLDSDTNNDPNAVTQIFQGTGAYSLSNLFTSGDPPLTFSVRTDADGHEVVDSNGHPVTAGGQTLHYGAVDTSVADQTTVVAGIGGGGGEQAFTPIFQLTIFANGDYQFVLLHSIDHPDHTTDVGSTSNGSLEETLFLDLTSLVTVRDVNGSTANLTGANIFDIGVIDDTPIVEVVRAEGEGTSFVIDPLDESIGGDHGVGNNGNGAADDVGSPPNHVPDPNGINAIGQVKSADGALSSMFEVLGSAGADGFGSPVTYAMNLTLSGAGQNGGVATQLSVTDLAHVYGNDSTIYLFAENNQIVGRVGSASGAIALRISLENPDDPNSAHLIVDQYLPINHGSDGNNFDAAAALKLVDGATLGVKLEVTVVDGDGDSATSSLVAVIASNDGSAITFEDDGPSINPNQNSSLRDWTIDEDVLPAAGHTSPVGNDSYDTPVDVNDYTQISNKPLGVDWGTDGAKALTFFATDSTHPTITDTNNNPVSLSSGGVPLTYEIITNQDGGQTLIAYKGAVHSPANEVFTLTLDPDADPSGAFSFQLLGALDHPNGDGQNTLNLKFGFNATDGDNDTATSFVTLRITDDVPYVKGPVIERTVDEDDIITLWSQGTHPNDGSGDGSLTEVWTGAAIVTGTLAGLVAPGADLPGKFGFTGTAEAQLAALGLFSKQTAQGNGENGKPLYYEITNGGSNEIVIIGREPSPQGNPVFSLTLNTVTGAYEFRLYDELIHMPGGDENTGLRSGQPVDGVQASIPYLDLGSIITYTDKDGDSVTLTGKFTITITDDVPHADIDLRGGSLTIDESGGNNADNTGSNSVKGLFATLESTLVDGQRLVGDDPDVPGDNNGNTPGNGAIAYARSKIAVVTDDSVIGADSPPYPHTYTLSVAGNAFSGLYVTDGSPINLSVKDGLVIGTVAGGPFAGKVAFAIAIDVDGYVSVAQYLSIKHDDRGDPNESNDNGSNGADASPDDTPNPVQQNLDGKIVVTLTVTDSDGDQSTDTVNIGKLITFLDDGPSISIDQAGDSRHPVELATIALDETHGGPNGGYDDVAASPSFLTSLTPSDSAKAIGIVRTPTGNQGTSVADLFDINVDGGADGVKSVVTTYSLTLKGNGNTLSNGSSTGVKTNLVVTELDGSLIDNTSDGQRTIYLFKAADGSIIGKIGIGSSLPDYVALHITIDPSTGKITVEQYLPIEHGNNNSYDEAALLKLIGNGDSLGVTATSIVTDGDDDTATASKTITLIDRSNSVISIDDDGPSVAQNAHLDVNVYEDGIGNADAGHPGEVPPSGSAQFIGAAGALNALVDFGADGPNTDLAFSLKSGPSGDSGLNSHGQDIRIVSDGNILRGYVDNVGNSGYQNGDRLVFTLTVNADGSFTFKLLDQIDHANQNGQTGDDTENNILLDLSKYIVATDGDGDTLTLPAGVFVVNVQDDVPFVKSDAVSSITVDEDDIQTSSSTGTSPDDGDSIDHSFTGNENVNQGGPANASGTLAGLVSVGADAPLTYGFAKNSDLQAYMQAQGLKSYGSALSYEVQGSTLYGFIDNAGSGGHYSSNSADRLVFTLELNSSNGNYKFSLYDQLDHQPGAGQNNLPINFGGALVATDYDGDSVSLTTHVVVNVTDDVPVLKNAPAVSITVDEDDIQTSSSTGTSPDDGDSIDHSFTGSENVNQGGPANATGSLANLVAISGADGPLTYGFGANAIGFMTLQNIKSHGDLLSYQVVGQTLYAFVNNGGAANAYDANDRLVFTLDVNQTSGQFTFSLHDQLDHSSGQGQNNLPIDFGGALVAVDYDQDPVTLTGHVIVNVTDDIPAAATGVPPLTAQVDEDDLGYNPADHDNSTGIGAEGNLGNDGVTDKHTFTASQLATLIAKSGADDAATVTLVSSFAPGTPVLNADTHAVVKSHGDVVLFGMDGATVVGYVDANNSAAGYQPGDRIVFKLTQDPNGDITFDLQDQIDHANASGESGILKLDLSATLQITDYDGDSVPVGQASFIIAVENDIPADTDATVTVGVSEDYLGTGVQPGAAYQSASATITNAQLQTLVVSGADDGVKFSLNHAIVNAQLFTAGDNSQSVTSNGANVRLAYDSVTNSVVGYVDGAGSATNHYEAGIDHVVFKVTDQGDGSFTVTLLDKIDHYDDEGHGALGDSGLLTLDLSKVIIATDFDGDAANLGVNSIQLVVENDIPTLVLNSSAAPLTVDETNFAVDASVSAASLFTVNYGADGPAASNSLGSFALHVKSAGVDSGLVTTVTNQHVFLFEEGGAIVGRAGDTSALAQQNGTIVFTLSLDVSNNLVLDQSVAVRHTNLSSYDEPTGLSASDLITLTGKATDYDLDSVTSTVNIGDKLLFKDDGPSIQLVNATMPTLTTDDTFVTGDPSTTSQDSKSFAGLFNVQFGHDGAKDLDHNGADADAVTYALSLNGGSNVHSGVYDTLTGQEVLLNVDGNGVIVGTVNGGLVTVFTISVDGSGNVTLTQDRAVRHDNASDPDEALEPTMLNIAGDHQVTLTATVTDGDLDTNHADLNISGAFQFRDDGPVAVDDTDTIDASAAQTLNFDDVSLGDNAEAPVVSPYHGFTIGQGGLYNPPGNGPFMTYAPHSGDNLLFIGEKDGNEQTGYEGPAGSPLTIAHADGSSFTALGAWLSSHGTEPLTITITGYLDGVEVASFSQDVHWSQAGGPTYVNLSVLGTVDKISFDSPVGQYFGLDDFSYIDNAGATGNVITAYSTAGGGADVLGADDASVSGVQAGSHLGAPISNGTGVGTAVEGSYGTLILNSDGSYNYVRADGVPMNGSDVFTYTLKDGDGDTSTATLTINIDDHEVLIGAQGGDLTVYESNLSDGSNQNASSLTQTGSFTISAADGLANLSIDGHLVVANGALTPSSTFTTALGNTFTVTSFDGTTVNYSYTLLDQEQHAAVQGNNTLPESLHVVATDSDGDFAESTITVNIIDDIPTAKDDVNSVTEGFGHSTSGNVYAGSGTGDVGDVIGADGPSAGGAVTGAYFGLEANAGSATITAVTSGGVTITGQYGDLLLRSDGSYTYTLKTNSIPAGVTSETFTYRIVDGDSDIDFAQLKISLNQDQNVPNVTGDTQTVYEDGLADGQQHGATSETKAGSFTVDAHNEIFALTIGSTVLTYADLANAASSNIDIPMAHGTLTITGYNPATGVVNYSYTLGGALTHVGQGEGNPRFDTISLSVMDATGDSSPTPAQIVISIVDDVPVIDVVNLPNQVDEGQSVSGTWTLNAGADGVSSIEVTVGAVTKTLSLASGANTVTFGAAEGLTSGTLTVDADHEWHFTANQVTADTPVTFSLKATDGDGDVSSDSQTITIRNVNEPLSISGAISGVVEEEHGLAGGIDDTSSSSASPNNDQDVIGNLDNTTNVLTGSFSSFLTVTGNEGSLSYSFNSALEGTPITKAGGGTLTSDGATVRYHFNGSTLTGYVDSGTAGYDNNDRKVFTLELNQPSAGQFRFTLLDNLDHHSTAAADDLENIIGINLDNVVRITDSGDTNDSAPIANFTVNVIDDTPVAAQQTAAVNEGQKPSMNVVFVIDTSGSMGSGSGSRMELAKAAAISLLNNSSVDFNQITVVSFSGTADANSPIWVNKAAAISYISNLSSGGNTNYDDALNLVKTSWGSGPTPADQTVVYFISDGEPNVPSGSVGIDGTEQGQWESFLSSHNVTASYAVGISTNVNDTDLTPISWAPGNANLPPVIITSASDLSATLTSSLPGSVSGNVLSGGGFGADDGHIQSITINGTTYTFNGTTITVSGNSPGAGDVINANGKQITIVTDLGGKLIFNFATNGTNQAGDWDYTAPTNVNTTSQEHFTYTLVDGDGDKASNSIDLTINNINAAPSGSNSTVSAVEDVPYTFTAADFGFSDPGDSPGNSFKAVKITTLETAGALKLNGVDVTLGQMVDIGEIQAGHLTFVGATNANGNNYATFTFQVQDDGGTANGGVDLDPTPNTMTINVAAVNDAPVATITPVSYTATEQTSLNLHGTGLSISDAADGNAGNMTVTLSVGEGIITVAVGNSGIVAGNVVGSGTSSVTITGTVTQINNLLGGVDTGAGSAGTIVYNDNTDAPSASTTLTLTVSDNGNVGGGALTGSDTAVININAVNDPPAVSNVTATETGINLTITDPDSSSFTLLSSAFANALGNPTLGLGANTIQVPLTAPASAISGTLQISDGAGGTANVIGLYLGTSGGNTNITAPLSNSPNAMFGFGGNDSMTGGSAGDYLFGGDGDDTLTGGGGADTIFGGNDNDTIRLANNDFVAGEMIDGGAGTDTILLTNATTVNFTTGTIAGVETLTGSSSNDDVTMTAAQWAGFNTINLGGGSSDDIRIQINGTVDISSASSTTMTSVENVTITGSTVDDTITLTGDQLNAMLSGTSSNSFNLNNGSNDTIHLLSTSTKLNGLSDTALQGVEIITADGASAGVTINLSSQSEAFNLFGSDFDDIITGGGGADRIDGGAGADRLSGGAGNDILLYYAGDLLIDGGSNTSANMLTSGNRGDVMVVNGNVDFTSLANSIFQHIETISMANADGSTGNSVITLNYSDISSMTDGTADPAGSNYSSQIAMRIDGDAGDIVNIRGDSGTWFSVSGIAPTGYNGYVHVSSGSNPSVNENAYLFISTGIDQSNIHLNTA